MNQPILKKIQKMNDNTIKEVHLHTQQLQRRAKIAANDTIRKWTDYVHSVGGGDSSNNWDTSSSGVSGDFKESDTEESTESYESESNSDSTSNSEGNSGPEQDLLLKVWGKFLRKGDTNDTRKEKRPRLNSRVDNAGPDLSADLEGTSEDDDSTSEGSDGSYGSLADFIEN